MTVFSLYAGVFQGNVENWLADLLKKSRRTVHSIICRAGSAIAEPNFNLLDFQSAFPAQVQKHHYQCVHFVVIESSFDAQF